MKNKFLLLSMLAVALTGCGNYLTETVTYKINEPVLMPASTFRNSVKVTSEPQKITNKGKICFYNDFLYIAETGKGIHIIDNRNTAEPKSAGFIELMGNADLAIRNGMLYADSYIDLVWFDISNPSLPVLKGRIDSIFPSVLPMTDNIYGIDYKACYEARNKGIVVGWKVAERTEDISRYRGAWWEGRPMEDLVYATGTDKGGNTGINGSMSRFSIHNDYLYSVVNNNLSIFDLQSEKPRKAASDTYIGWNVETIFGYGENLFMGTPTGMLIYNAKDPLKPEFASSVQHVFGCDPVIVDEDLAYVTVHSEANRCGQTANELMIVDVSDVYKPKNIATYSMTSPKGLAIDSDKLFLCDDGLKVFGITEPQTLISNKLAHFKNMLGYDVIAYDKLVMMIADDGIYQYDYSDSSNIKLLSKIPFEK